MLLEIERRSRIVSLLKKKSSIRTKKLVEDWGVTNETIRPDLNFLQEKGLLKRVHGGAVSPEKAESCQEVMG